MHDDRPEPPKFDPDGDYINAGGPIDRVSVSLRVFGDSVVPSEISELLGCTPTSALRKGDRDPTGPYRRVATTGSWLLSGESPNAVELESQVMALLDRLNPDPDVWRDLTQRFDVDIFCGVFLDQWNRGFALSPTVLTELALRHLVIGFDIYSHIPGDAV